MIRATIAYLFTGIFVLLFSPGALLWGYFSKDGHLTYTLARFCIRIAGWICGVRVEILGKEKISSDETYLFVSNHQGNFDGPVLIHATGRDLRALIKKEILRIPVLSLILKQLRFVPINRSDPKQARAGIDSGAKLLREGYSFFAFPEGTRSRTGKLGQFKKGAFVMALKAGKRVVPISILGSNRVQQPGKYGVRPGTIRLLIHDPISTEGMTMDDRERLVAMTRDAIAAGLGDVETADVCR